MTTTIDHYSTLAKSYTTLDFSEVSLIMDDDIVFNCQYFEEAEPVVGKAKALKTLIEIFEKLREAKPTVHPQFGLVGDQSQARCHMGNLTEGDHCLLFVKDLNDAKGAVCAIKLNDKNQLTAITICRILQRLTAIVSVD